MKQESKLKLFLIIAIFITSFTIYSNSLSNEFVYDDHPQVLENEWIKDIRLIPEILSSNAWGPQGKNEVSNYYRPLMLIVFMLDYHVFGLDPWGFHIVNVFFHGAVSVLIFLMTALLLNKYRQSQSESYLLPSFVAAMLFAVHPVHTEAVAWVSGLTEPSFTFFGMLCLYFYIRHREGSKLAYPISVISFVFAVLCKETALTLPLILAVYDISFRKEDDSALKFMKRCAPYLIVMGIYLAVRFFVLSGVAPLKRHSELSLYQYIINVFPLFAQYLEKLLIPINLNAYYTFHPISSIFELKGILSIIITAAFALLGFAALKRNKSLLIPLSLIVIPLLPVLYIPALGDNTFADRYLYLPSVGFVILLAFFSVLIKHKAPRSVFPCILVSVLLFGSYSAGTISRNRVWKDDYTLFLDTVRKSPDAAAPHNYLGHTLLQKGLIYDAIRQYQLALALDPNLFTAHNNLGNAYYKLGFLDDAINEYEIAISLNPDQKDVLQNLETVYAIRGSIHDQKDVK